MNDGALIYKQIVDDIYPQVEEEIFNLDPPYTQLNFPDDGGVTAYFSRNMTKDDLKIVQRFLDSEKIDILNTRAFKRDEQQFEITVGSKFKEGTREDIEFENATFSLEFGEFTEYLNEVVLYLEQAMEFASNQNQREMIQDYILHFKSGDVEAHKDSQRKWVKDKGPVVETNIGWVEVYVDPENKRG